MFGQKFQTENKPCVYIATIMHKGSLILTKLYREIGKNVLEDIDWGSQKVRSEKVYNTLFAIM